ncbi:PAS domain S-box protein [Rossellomorea aquimaris]|uniref:histidine kinase n=1 Tax=Rossellomorea aquimaris TaxID=189382 RepID=A0A5D4TD21_9BACI|nr:PAS domain S-box protein [Rossellomorea aquimaris]TYS72036.1 PAS domain S-box protein [Rossellomorea aquimaris]
MNTPTAVSKEIHALLAAFYENTDDAVLITQFASDGSRDCFFIGANPAACDLLGYEMKDLLKLNPDQTLFSNISSMLLDLIKKRLIETKRAMLEIELCIKERESVVVEMKSAMVEVNSKQYVLHIIRNIETKKAVQDEWLAERNRTMELLDGIQAYIIIMDRSGRIISMNTFTEEKTGYTADEVKGRVIWEFLVDEEQQMSFKRTCQGGLKPEENHESCWISKKGEKLSVQWSVSFLKEDETKKGFIIGSGIDISQRKQYEETLLESTQKYRSLVEDNPDGIVVFSEENMMYLNKEAQKILGYPSEMAKRDSLFSRVHPYDRDKALAYYKGMVSKEDFSHNIIDVEVIRPDSSRVTVEVKGITRKVQDETFIHLVIRDVSLQKKAESDLRKMNGRMENILSSTDEILIGLCKELRVTFVNHSLIKLMGQKEDHLVGIPGQALFDMLSDTGGNQQPIHLLKLMSGSDPQEIYVLQNGVRKYFEVKVLSLGLDEGALVTMYDITDRKLLEQQRGKYYDAIACGITVQDSSGRVIFANQNAEEIIGLPKDKIKKLSLENHKWLLLDENGDELSLKEHPWRKAVRTQKEIRNFIMGFQHPQHKSLKWILVNTRNVLMEEEDRVEKVIATFQDITAKVEMDKMIKEKEKLALAGQLAAGVAHEIKNPLTSSLGFLKLMRDEEVINHDYLNIVLDELESINLVTSEFLVLAEPEAAREEDILLFEDVLIPLVSSFKRQLRECGAEIDFRMTPSRQELRGVKEKIRQLFLNIFRNSLEAMPEGGTIDVSAIREHKHIVVRIKDEGVGIPPERLKRLGEPFYSIKEKGTGLGLLLCKKIAHEHRGAIVIKSVQGRGTIVEVSLPVTNRK